MGPPRLLARWNRSDFCDLRLQCPSRSPEIGNGLNTVSESTVSNTELSEFFWAHWVLGSELSEFLSPYYLCAKANSPSFSQNSPMFAIKLSEAQWVLFSRSGKGCFFLRVLLPKRRLIETTWPRSSQMTQAVPSSLPPHCLQHALGWSVSLVMAFTRQVPYPVKNPVRMQIGVSGASSECFGTRHPRVWARKPCKSFGPKNSNWELLDPSSHPWGPVMAQPVRKAYRRKWSLHWKISNVHIIQSRWFGGFVSILAWLGQSMWRNPKCLAIVKFNLQGG